MMSDSNAGMALTFLLLLVSRQALRSCAELDDNPFTLQAVCERRTSGASQLLRYIDIQG